jgi:hypothetical protein
MIVPVKKRGIYMEAKGGNPNNLQDKVADFSYSSDALAQLIAEMWLGQHTNLLKAPAVTDYGQRMLNAKAVLAARGIYLEKPIVITEDEYVDGFSLLDAGLITGTVNVGIVFVLPDEKRATRTAGTPLTETAKMLMAVTPNGI